MSGRLGEENMFVTAKAAADFADEAKAAGCEEIYAFATEAVRSAANRREFVTMLEKYGLTVDIVDGNDEATLGFSGAYTEGVWT